MMSSFKTVELSDSNFEAQGLRFLTVKSPHLKGRGDICLFVPKVNQKIDNLPIYILLHGVYGSSWIWALKGGVHVTANNMMASNTIKPAIIAMPSDGLWGDGSAYTTHHQKQFDQWIVKDVINAIKENIPQAKNSTSTCIGGLSMGGYGALALGGRFCSKFKAISAHSAITELDQMELFVEESIAHYTQKNSISNVFSILKKNKNTLPPFRFDCGKTDQLLAANKQLHKQLLKEKIPHIYEEFNGGHQWSYWAKNVRKTLLFFDKYTQ